jgi:hypothetical protein
MLATYLNSLHECFSRRVALVLFGVAILVAIGFNAIVHVKGSNRSAATVLVGTQPSAPPAIVVPSVMESELRATGTLWILLAVFAAAPLLTATLEKGWLEMIFSKGIGRWRVFAGRLLAAITLYSFVFAIAVFPLAVRLWCSTGVPTWQISVALLVQSFSFAALLSVAALVSLSQRGVAVTIVAPVALWVLSPLLAGRQHTFYQLFSSHFAREAVDWAYRVLPKCTELEDVCVSFIQSGDIGSSWPFWSTALFAAVIFGLTFRQLAKKSF